MSSGYKQDEITTRIGNGELLKIIEEQEHIISTQSRRIAELAKKNAELESLVNAFMSET